MKKKYGKYLLGGALAVLACSASIPGAFAQPQPEPVAPMAEESSPQDVLPDDPPTTTLDRAAIEKFYADSVASQLAGTNQTVNFIKRHAHEKLQATMKIISRIHGAPQTQKEEMSLDKRQLILKTKEGARNTKLKSLKTNLLSVSLAQDGKSAKVKNTSFAVSMVRLMSPEGGAVTMKAEQSMLCDDDLVLTNGGVIQYEKSRCNIEVNIEQR